MLDRGQVRDEALPDGATGYRIGDDRTAPSASGRDRVQAVIYAYETGLIAPGER